VTGFESIIDQKQPIGILTTLLRKENIPHALLFTGIEGIGKHDAAITFAMACNCTGLDSGQLSENAINHLKDHYQDKKQKISSIPCGCCRSCKKIQSDSHPDILTIHPTGSFIKIDQIRDLYQTLTMKPYEARYRIVIVADAHRMNAAASNAFLKILEEPPDQTILILIADKKSDVLQTVASRCQHIRFRPISRKTLAKIIAEKEGRRPSDAWVIAEMANGSVSRALAMSQSDWIGHRNWLIKSIGLDPQASAAPKSAGLLLSISAQLSENRDRIENYLEIITSWLRDLIIVKYQPNRLIHIDCEDKIKTLSKKFTLKSLLYKIDAVQSAQLAIRRSNSNAKLVLDLLMFQLMEPAMKHAIEPKGQI